MIFARQLCSQIREKFLPQKDFIFLLHCQIFQTKDQENISRSRFVKNGYRQLKKDSQVHFICARRVYEDYPFEIIVHQTKKSFISNHCFEAARLYICKIILRIQVALADLDRTRRE